MPCRAYVEKAFRGESLNLISLINSVINEYNAQGYSLTLRQVYYQLVARDVISNNERSYKNIGNLINDARLAGLIDWEAIEDRTRNLRSLSHWDNPKDIILSAAQSYRIDRWADQENYVEVWVEKDALIGVVARACNDIDVPHFSCRGYVSQSEMWAAAQRLIFHERHGKNAVIIHLGDHDPSGIDMSRDIESRLELFGVETLRFNRIALNMDQIEAHSPPPNPAKLSDSRAQNYIAKFGYESWELDALEPSAMDRLIRQSVIEYMDTDLFDNVEQREKAERQLLKKTAASWDRVSHAIENWEGQP